MAISGAASLAFPVRLSALGRYLGHAALALTVLSAVPMLFALADRNFSMAGRFGAVVAVLVGLGLLLSRLPRPDELRLNEGLAVLSLVFVGGSLAMTWPLMGGGLGFVDAVFESVSGITTTGLTVVETVQDRSRSLLFARAWLQWTGGLIILALALVLVLGPGTIAKRVAAIDVKSGDVIGGTWVRARRAIMVYTAFTIILGVLLLALTGEPFDALAHTLTTVSTGGFSSFGNSLAGFDGVLPRLVIMVFCVLGSVSILLYHRAWTDGGRHLWRDPAVQLFLAASLVTVLLLGATMLASGQHGWRAILANAPLIGLSAQTTAGFTSLDLAEFDPASKLVLMVAMAIGGDVGSTSGGIKILRLMLVLQLLRIVLLRTALTQHSVASLPLGGKPAEPGEVETALSILSCYLLTVLVSWLAFLLAGYPPLDSLFEVVSATSTAGLSTGIVGPDLPYGLKLLLCVDMLLGRLEFVALLILTYPTTWTGGR